jgi:hypothetical protein
MIDGLSGNVWVNQHLKIVPRRLGRLQESGWTKENSMLVFDSTPSTSTSGSSSATSAHLLETMIDLN